MAVMIAAGDGISPSMMPSARLRRRLMVWSTWNMAIKVAPKKICTAHVKSKECVRKSTRVSCAWDSGSVIVLVSDLLTRTQVGTQCPEYTWKKYLPHRLKLTKREKEKIRNPVLMQIRIDALKL